MVQDHDPPPHLDRITRRIRALDAPMIQLVGWPGTGKRRLLAALPRALGSGVVTLSAVDAIDDRPLADSTYLVAEASDPSRWRRWSRRLGAQQTLIVACERFEPLDSPQESTSPAVIGPSDLLLEASEAAVVLRRGKAFANDRHREERSAAWLEWCGGWLYPLELLSSSEADPESLRAALSVPGLEDFLRFRVMGSLGPSARSLLAQIARATAAGAGTRESELRRSLGGDLYPWTELLDRRGLLLRTGRGGLRLPALLQAHLELDMESEVESDGGDSSYATKGDNSRRKPGDVVPHTRTTVGFDLRLLGAAEVGRVLSDGDQDALRWRFRRVLEVLAFLASSPGLACHRDRLVDAIWPEQSSTRAESNLHPTLSHLRRMLRDPLHPKRAVVRLRQAVYSLAPGLDWRVDVVRFERLVDEVVSGVAGVEAMEEAADLYRGAFLQGLHSPWIDDRREQLRVSYHRVLEALGAAFADDDRWSDAEDAYRRLLIEDSLREEIHVSIMGLYARRGTDQARASRGPALAAGAEVLNLRRTRGP